MAPDSYSVGPCRHAGGGYERLDGFGAARAHPATRSKATAVCKRPAETFLSFSDAYSAQSPAQMRILERIFDIN